MQYLKFKKILFVIVTSFLFGVPAYAEQNITKAPANSEKADQSKRVKSGNTDNFDYTHTFYREKLIEATNGNKEIKREYVERTLPGEELLAVATYTYKKDIPAKEVVFTLPLPKETIYVEGSATDEKYVWFSADNGQSWYRFRNLRVTEPDGTKRIATGKDVTHLQWRMASELQPRASGKLEYKVIIR